MRIIKVVSCVLLLLRFLKNWPGNMPEMCTYIDSRHNFLPQHKPLWHFDLLWTIGDCECGCSCSPFYSTLVSAYQMSKHSTSTRILLPRTRTFAVPQNSKGSIWRRPYFSPREFQKYNLEEWHGWAPDAWISLQSDKASYFWQRMNALQAFLNNSIY